jgi:hypothetical protein
MVLVTVTSATKKETFHKVELQPDHSITFEEYRADPPA